jgi:hypothetical protein
MSTYWLKPIAIKDANGFVGKNHRHNGPVPGGKLFAVSCIAMNGQNRPVAKRPQFLLPIAGRAF